MALSQNGWPASPGLPVAPISAGGVRVTVAPAAAPLLGHVMARFHESVEPLRAGECWGFAFRDVRGAGDLSNHASGTAIDVNAPAHPLGKSGTFTPSQVAAIRVILAECGGLVRWGGDYTARKDEMHFEVVGEPAAVKAWRPPAPAPAPLPAPPIEEDDMKALIVRDGTGGTWVVAADLSSKAAIGDPNWTLPRLLATGLYVACELDGHTFTAIPDVRM